MRQNAGAICDPATCILMAGFGNMQGDVQGKKENDFSSWTFHGKMFFRRMERGCSRLSAAKHYFREMYNPVRIAAMPATSIQPITSPSKAPSSTADTGSK